jgi:hypothetical protein
VAWFALTGVWAALALYLFSHPDRPAAQRQNGASASTRSMPRTIAGGTTIGLSRGERWHAPAGEPAVAPPEVVRGLPDARRVAAAFATAYATWRYDESAETMTARLMPQATPALRARLGTPASGATAARQALKEIGEYSTASVEAVQTQGLTAAGIDLLVLVRQEIHTAAGLEVRRPSYAVHLTGADGQWLVEDFTP